jgi:HTH-type transcriptional regulator/antitoxin HipB
MDYPVVLASQLQPYLRSLRKAQGLTQAQLAQRLGIGQSRVADIEAKPGVISVEQLLHILSVLNAGLLIRHTPSDVNPDATPKLTQDVMNSANSEPDGGAGSLPQGQW